MIKCQVCGYENPDDAKTCLNCGSPVEKQKVSEPLDDISGEATVMLGMPTRSGIKTPVIPGAPPPSSSAPPSTSRPPTPFPPGPTPGGIPPPPPPPFIQRAGSVPPPPPPAPARGMPPPPPQQGSASAPPPPPFNPSAAPPASPVGAAPATGGAKQNALCIASLVTGIIAVFPGCCCAPISLVMGIAGIVTGFIGRKQVLESNGAQTGDKLALAGMICGGLALLMALALIILQIVGVAIPNLTNTSSFGQ
ncbi:DUF4190 domain-containing protein [Candidatus Sumerlaeota bacterium]|nr:DUF4190 domain-containing protein [Candidatus Sumerlaeota bacterium]